MEHPPHSMGPKAVISSPSTIGKPDPDHVHGLMDHTGPGSGTMTDSLRHRKWP